MMKGYNGKMLWIDLSTKVTREEMIPEEWRTLYIGGEGFVAKLMYDRVKPGMDPLSEENLLIFAMGPVNGTLAPSSGRTCVGFKSPLTGTIGVSNVGGMLAPELKKTGYDIIILTGKSEKPVYVFVKDSKVEFLPAETIWGLDVEKTEEAIRKELGDPKVRIAEIGPAGENLVKFSSIMIDAHRAAGRGGAGAVMGSKNVKALVVRGSGKRTDISNPEAFKLYTKQARKELKEEPFVDSLLSKYGTSAFTASVNAVGCLPTRNWQTTTFEHADKLSHEAYHKVLKVQATGCHACPIACGRKTEIQHGKYSGTKGYGPEFEGLGAYGSKTGVSDLNEVVMANFECNKYGLDNISTGQIIATAMEWYEKGIINTDTTDGLELNFGNGEAMIELTRKIALREGFGNLLAEGSERAAKVIGNGAEDYVMTVKGMELASCGVRASKGEVLSHLGSERGADHLRPFASTIDALGYLSEELGITEKKVNTQDSDKHWVKPLKELSMLTNLLGTCLFTTITLAVKGETWTGIYNAVTGNSLTLAEMLQCAERVSNLERLFNVREGFTRKDDTLPIRLRTEPAPDGLGQGEVVDERVIIDEFYDSMGWDSNGVPTEAKLKELNLM
jgi:aldehyde:ferredoxin oxidoreductase